MTKANINSLPIKIDVKLEAPRYTSNAANEQKD